MAAFSRWPSSRRKSRRRGALFHTDAVQSAGRCRRGLARLGGRSRLGLRRTSCTGPRGSARCSFAQESLSSRTRREAGRRGDCARAPRTRRESSDSVSRRGSARERRELEAAGIERLRDRLERMIVERVPGSRVIGARGPRLPNTSAMLFEGVPGDALLIRLDLEGIAVSVGSACSSGTLAPSPAILSLRIPASQARSVVRFSLSRLTTQEEIDRVRRCPARTRGRVPARSRPPRTARGWRESPADDHRVRPLLHPLQYDESRFQGRPVEEGAVYPMPLGLRDLQHPRLRGGRARLDPRRSRGNRFFVSRRKRRTRTRLRTRTDRGLGSASGRRWSSSCPSRRSSLSP